ncbi:MAG: ABC transporter permease [Candidatus Eremiobacteraeota bacterium]|nr:ABC transporter permease [Candidatus Eremiobacteraeota bacterium]
MNRSAFDVRGYGAVVYKEIRHVMRDRITLILALGLPILQVIIFGHAINTKVEHIATAVFNEDLGDASYAFLDSLAASRTFDLSKRVGSRQALMDEIVSGRIRVAFDIPPNFTADLRAGRAPQVQALIDASDASVAQPAFAAASALGAAFMSTDVPPKVDVRSRVLFNPGLRSANFFVPGLIGLIMQLITMFLTALSIVGEREKGTLDQIMVTPIGALGLMLGKITPYAVIGFVDMLLVVAAMRWIFDVPVAGSVSLLIVLSLGFLMAALGLGLLVSSVAQTQIQAMLGVLAMTLPSILLSGFFFQRSLMPPIMQWLGYVIPLTYFFEILRGIILRGASLGDLIPPVVAMLALGAFLLLAASIRFTRRSSS